MASVGGKSFARRKSDRSLEEDLEKGIARDQDPKSQWRSAFMGGGTVCCAPSAPGVWRRQGSNECRRGIGVRWQDNDHSRSAAGRREGIGATSSRCSRTPNMSGRQGWRAKAANKRRERREARVLGCGRGSRNGKPCNKRPVCVPTGARFAQLS